MLSQMEAKGSELDRRDKEVLKRNCPGTKTELQRKCVCVCVCVCVREREPQRRRWR